MLKGLRARIRTRKKRADVRDDERFSAVEFSAVAMSFPRNSQQWMSRMVERIDLSDVERYDRSVTVHVDLARLCDVAGLGPTAHRDSQVIVPIGRIRRRAHMGVEVFDASGSDVPRLSSTEERALVSAYAKRLARGLLQSEDARRSIGGVAQFLSLVRMSITAPPADARAAADKLDQILRPLAGRLRFSPFDGHLP